MGTSDATRSGSSFVALLRGINVGGRNPVRMPELVACFRDAGYGDVSTYLQSGNVLFSADHETSRKLEAKVEAMLEQRFGIPILVIVRSRDELAKTIEAAPADHGSREAAQRGHLPQASAHREAGVRRAARAARGRRFGGARSGRDLLLTCRGTRHEDPDPAAHGDARLQEDDHAHLAHVHHAAREARRRLGLNGACQTEPTRSLS